MRKETNQTNQKDPDKWGHNEANLPSELLRTLWCSVKDDYRTLIGLDENDPIDMYDEDMEKE
jgi:hypothetical protein